MCVGRKFSGTTNSAWQAWRKCGSACGRNGQSGNGAVFGRGTSLSLSLSLSLSSLALFGRLKFLNALFLGFCALFVILSLLQKGEKSKGLKAHLLFLDTSLTLSMTNLGKSLNLIVCHTLMLSKLTMTADFVILSVAKNPKNLRYTLFMDTSLTLSMTKKSVQYGKQTLIILSKVR